MRFGPVEIRDKLGRAVVLRNAEIEDADMLVEYMKVTAAETRYLVREPEEAVINTEREKAFINWNIESPKDLMMIATIDGKHVGNCSVSSKGPYHRYSHRCEVAIALYQEYWGSGIGSIMFGQILEVARSLGYEQAELEVVADNKNAISLYEKHGFLKCGQTPNNMKYSDGTYADAIQMVKVL